MQYDELQYNHVQCDELKYYEFQYDELKKLNCNTILFNLYNAIWWITLQCNTKMYPIVVGLHLCSVCYFLYCFYIEYH